jgi:hypothetical protein
MDYNNQNYHEYNNTDDDESEELFYLPYVLIFCLGIGCMNTVCNLCKLMIVDYKKNNKLSKLSKKIVSDDIDNLLNECSICLEEFKVGDTIITLPCNHIYHKKCIGIWAENNNNCPLCRVII